MLFLGTHFARLEPPEQVTCGRAKKAKGLLLCICCMEPKKRGPKRTVTLHMLLGSMSICGCVLFEGSALFLWHQKGNQKEHRNPFWGSPEERQTRVEE